MAKGIYVFANGKKLTFGVFEGKFLILFLQTIKIFLKKPVKQINLLSSFYIIR